MALRSVGAIAGNIEPANPVVKIFFELFLFHRPRQGELPSQRLGNSLSLVSAFKSLYI